MIVIKQGDITKEGVQVIVNAANTQLKGGGGVDGAIHRAAGSSVMDECRNIGRCAIGSAVITNAGDLRAERIIHTVGPVWRGGSNKEAEMLKSAYISSFKLAIDNNLRSIAFPAISTGVYDYPIMEAANIALELGKKFENDFDEIRYICFSKPDFDLYNQVFSKINK
ncbi:macro domain-containing protein [Candidatus Omnitrophota bacterium]